MIWVGWVRYSASNVPGVRNRAGSPPVRERVGGTESPSATDFGRRPFAWYPVICEFGSWS